MKTKNPPPRLTLGGKPVVTMEELLDRARQFQPNVDEDGDVIPAERPTDMELLTPDELAFRLKVDVAWIYEKRRPRCASPIPAIPMGRELRFSWQAILNWLQERAAEDAESLRKRRTGPGTSATHSRATVKRQKVGR